MSGIDTPRTTDPRYVPESPWGPGSAVAVAIVAALAPAFIVFGLTVWLANVDPATLAGAHTLASPLFLLQMVLGQIFSLAIIWFAAGRGGQRTQVLRLRPREETPVLTAAGLGLLLIAAIAPVELLLYRLAGLELFTDGRWLLSHNGLVDRAVLPLSTRAESTNDSALLAALIFERGLDRLADTVAGVASADPNARLNILAGNGSQLIATTWGDTLSVLRRDDGTVLASEPYDDDPRWRELPDRHLVSVVGSADVELIPLKGSS